MRCLILTDIRANPDALEAVAEPYDRLVVPGDLVDYGPESEAAVFWLMEGNATGISGNHDFAMAPGADCRSSPISLALSVATREHFRRLMSNDGLGYLRALRERFTLKLDSATCHLVHTTPRNPRYEYLSGDAG